MTADPALPEKYPRMTYTHDTTERSDLMGSRVFTPEQSAAIAERKKTLLVSAAAGSGKTATLTERIIVSLTDKENPADISRMLIVTYTRAAAQELRTRIGDAVRAALANDPRNRHLSRQLLLLPGAKIKTIDAFCGDILRTGATTIGLSPQFRVADETERMLLARDIMDGLIDDLYAGGADGITADEFAAMAEEICGVRNDDSLADILLELADNLSGYAEGSRRLFGYADRAAEDAEREILETPYGIATRRAAADLADHYLAAYEALIRDISAEAPDSKWIAFLTAECAAIREFRDSLSRTYAEARSVAYAFPFATAPSVPAKKRTAAEDFARTVRMTFKKDFQSLCKSRFTYSAEYYKESIVRTAHFTSLLAKVIDLFNVRFRAEKKRRAICDFGDLETYTLSLLIKDGEPTRLARTLSQAYDYIYIDEYQDVNSMQHRIFTAIGRENNIFMVGDVKQSIYSFRHAEPDIFTHLKRTFPPLSAAGDSPAATIFMSRNFRCDRNVISFTNAVFDRLFGAAGESIAYEAGDRLEYGKNQPENDVPVTLALFGAHADDDDDDEISDDADSAPDDTENASPVFDAEIRYVVEEIRRLLRDGRLDNGEKIRPKDIAVLLRNGKGDAEKFRRALESGGIPAAADDARDFFLNPEILLVLSLLHAIDNPRRDIPLAGLLRSPLYRFTMDELCRIRAEGERGETLYDAVLGYRDNHPDNEKVSFFITELERFRDMAEGIPVDELIRRLYADTALVTLADNGKNGKDARKNLLLLYHYARTFEASSFRGLYQFISYIDEIIRQKKTVPATKGDAGDTDAVRIMTVHHSKGLEFPVCFLARTGRAFSTQSIKKPLLFDPALGTAVRFRDETGLALTDNPVRRAVISGITEAQNEEEMRVLYVALTRARERLYVTGSAPARGNVEKLLERAACDRRFFSRYTAKTARTHLDMILAALNGRAAFYTQITPEESETETAEVIHAEAAAPANAAVDAETLARRFSFRYPYLAVSLLPSKLSVSKLSPTALDSRDDGEVVLTVSDEDRTPKKTPLPRFMREVREPTAAERGTATHLFMQFCDFSRLRTDTAATELCRLADLHFIDKADADIVFVDEAEAFRRSALFRELGGAAKIYRELRFHARFPAVNFTRDPALQKALKDEFLLVQGVIDCIYFRSDGTYVLLDYKTDRVGRTESRAAAAERLRLRHTEQLSYYAAAATHIFGAPPADVLLYSLPLADTVKIDPLPIDALSLPMENP